MLSTRRTIPLIFTVALASCALELEPELSSAPDPDSAPILTERTSYTLERSASGWEGEIGFEYTNPTDRTISLLNCNEQFGLLLEIWQDDDWVTAWGPALPECLSPPIDIPPGESYATTLRVFGGFPRNNVYPKFRVEPIDGDYRIVITSAYWDYDHDGPSWGEEPSLEHRVSNTFELRSR